MNKLRNIAFLVLSAGLIFMSCSKEKAERIKMKKSYDNASELEADILKVINNQYGMEFEIGNALEGDGPDIGTRGKDFGFYGDLRPADITENEKKFNTYYYYTVCNEKSFETQAHVRMFESQLREDVSKILNDIGIKYEILDFAGMDRDVYKWSKNSSYESYKGSGDYETWIYINMDQSIDEKDYPKIILPMLKKINKALGPDFNPTVIFYKDHYHNEFYDPYEKKNWVTDYDNCDMVFIDLGKWENIDEWTEHDIEVEINPVDSDLFITNWKKAHNKSQIVNGRKWSL